MPSFSFLQSLFIVFFSPTITTFSKGHCDFLFLFIFYFYFILLFIYLFILANIFIFIFNFYSL